MSEDKFLPAFEGHQAVIDTRAELATTGSDFTEWQGKVSHENDKLHPRRLQLEVSEVIEETATCKTLRLKPAEGGYLPPFQAGQYINIFASCDGTDTARPYAISSAPSVRDHYDLTVRKLPGGYIANFLVDTVKPGMRFESSGPMGTFHHNPLFHGNDLVFLAGGSGVAPAMSMIEEFIAQESSVKFHLIYGSRLISDIIFKDRLTDLAVQHDFFTVTEVISEPEEGYRGKTGFMSAELMLDILGDIEGKTFYVCGPSVMYEFCLKELVKMGVPHKNTHVEANGAPKFPDRLEGWPNDISLNDEVTVTVQGQRSFIAKVGEPLLNSLERNGFEAENACRSGECSLCRVKVVSGKVFNPPEAKLRSSDRQYGWCHSCVAFPLEDIEILL